MVNSLFEHRTHEVHVWETSETPSLGYLLKCSSKHGRRLTWHAQQHRDSSQLFMKQAQAKMQHVGSCMKNSIYTQSSTTLLKCSGNPELNLKWLCKTSQKGLRIFYEKDLFPEDKKINTPLSTDQPRRNRSCLCWISSTLILCTSHIPTENVALWENQPLP